MRHALDWAGLPALPNDGYSCQLRDSLGWDVLELCHRLRQRGRGELLGSCDWGGGRGLRYCAVEILECCGSEGAAGQQASSVDSAANRALDVAIYCVAAHAVLGRVEAVLEKCDHRALWQDAGRTRQQGIDDLLGAMARSRNSDELVALVSRETASRLQCPISDRLVRRVKKNILMFSVLADEERKQPFRG